ncbi:unnamed protein product [Allacma fusca]|uniref:Protein-ribulosamine 3-kinase n=1 Tax=Allacma fusca TaxID=39272 RepID=A0A8J2PZJ3_9HEXA|nr:unnamed protein product [Allacma fusca]
MKAKTGLESFLISRVVCMCCLFQAADMFAGEKAGLEAILKTNTIRVPTPYYVVTFGRSSAALVMESVNIGSASKVQADLGSKLADLHLHNINLCKMQKSKSDRITSSGAGSSDQEAVHQFGFHMPTSCGYILQSNQWEENWAQFYIRKLASQVEDIISQNHDPQLKDTWEPCMLKIQKILEKINPVPSLLHGDLWSGNAGAVDGEPLAFDPATFYGHHEYDLGIANMFGGFTENFYKAYHSKIPKESGFELRLPIYELFHHLNHWNHFGAQYKRSALRLMSSIIKS